MRSHLLNSEFINSDKFNLPPEKMIHLPYPEDEWYREFDPIAHDRVLHLTRGIHVINEWWRLQDVEIFYHIAANEFYLVKALPQLEIAVRKIHQILAPQQKLDDHYLVFGNGATQVINAALYASTLYHSLQKNPAVNDQVKCSTLWVTEQMPGYLEDNSLIQVMHKNLLAWIPFEDRDLIPHQDLLEFITTPNNPDGAIRKKLSSAAYTIHDRVNHWSFFLNKDDRAIKEDTLEYDQISIFSLSKFLSFSGSRVGYAFVKDPQIAHFMKYFMVMSTHGVVADSQYRCWMALLHLLETPGLLIEYTQWIRTCLKKRWKRLHNALNKTPLILLNTQGPTAWLKAPAPAAEYLLERYKIEATYGDEYGATPDHFRLNLLAKTNQFDELIWRLTHL